MTHNPLRDLPSVNEVLAALSVDFMVDRPRDAVVAAVRAELAETRRSLKEDAGAVPSAAAIAARAGARVSVEVAPKLRPVINATGIILHTNLGRAPMADVAALAANDAARGYLNLELDLRSGTR